MQKILTLIFLLVFCQNLFAQYTLNGNATRDACNEYTLTAAVNWQGGSVWNNIKIDLTQSFDFNFDVLLGSNNSPGADGIAFVLQPVSTSVGSSGGGMGYEGITPAVGVIIDTYENGNNNDPAFDHIAVQLNGDIGHTTVNNIAGPVTALNGNDNIEDGNWHSLRIVWNASSKTLTAAVDGSLRLSVVKDFVTDVFSGDPFVYWGFTGATGGENNLQKFKIALNPAFKFSANQKRCINEPVTFYDSTISFTPIVKFYWDFGDGSPVDSVNINPVHTYTAAGDYTVKQKVIGADGCEATNTKVVQIGSKPLANFGYSNPLCTGLKVQFTDSTLVAVGIPNQWNWIHNGTVWSNLQNPERVFAAGAQTIQLVTTSNAGCASDTAVKIILISPAPDVSFTFNDACKNIPVPFTATDNSGNVSDWKWTFGDGGMSNAKDTMYVYTTGGTFPVNLRAVAANGCITDLPPKNIKIYSTQAFAGNDT
ncbi:MAG: PKD domain-containing protein, partial [Ferruginibacter sp.]